MTNYIFHILSSDGKMLDYRPVSKSQNRQKLDITPLCCQAKSKTLE